MKPRPPIFNQPPFGNAFGTAFGGAFGQKASNPLNAVAGLVLWMDARKVKAADLVAGNVSKWEDRSNFKHIALQATTTKQPIFNAAGINGEPSLGFDASTLEDMTIADANSLDLNGSFTAYCVCKPATAASLSMFSKNASAGYRWIWEARAANVGTRLFLTGTAGADDIASPGDITVNQPSLSEIVFDVAAPKNAVFTNLGTSMGIKQTILADINTNAAALHLGSSGASLQFFNGEIAQIVIYNRKLLVAERNFVGNYLANAYGMTWADIRFDPAELSGLVLGLDASIGITLNASDVSAWLDQSGNGNDAAQATAADQPAFNATGINSKPSVTFVSASAEEMDVADDNTLDLTADFTAYCVCKPASFADTTILQKGTSAAIDYQWLLTATAANGDQSVVTNPGANSVVSNTNDITPNQEVILEVLYKSGGGTELTVFTKSGVAMGIDFPTGASIQTSGNQMFIGSGGGTKYFNGEIGSLFIYNRILLTSERNNVGNSLAAQYGLTWTDVVDVQFDPNLISNLVLWLDAGVGVSSDENGVSAWDDQSGSGNNAAKVTSIDQPVFNGTGINGNPSLTFNGATSRLDAANSASLNFTSSFTVYVVNKVTSLGTFRTMFAKDVNVFRFLYEATSGKAFSIINNNQKLSTNGTTVNTDQIMEMHYQVTSGGTINFTANGASLGGATSSIITIARGTGPFIIGQFGTPSSQVFAGEIGQILIYDKLLSTAERNIVGNYLADRYGLTWTTIT